MFERFTDRARRVLILAEEEARQLSGLIGTEYLLLGLIREGEGVAATALASLGVSLEGARAKVAEAPRRLGIALSGSPPFTARAKKVLELSWREAQQLGHNYIGTEHLLLGLIREGHGVGARVLVGLGIDLGQVRQTVVQLLPGDMPAEEVRTHLALHGVRPRRPEPKSVACSFCGGQPPESGQLISGTDAFICEHCVRRWARRVDPSEGPTAQGVEGSAAEAVECQFCGGTPAIHRPVGDGHFTLGLCRNCLRGITEQTMAKTEELCGLPYGADLVSAESDDAAWAYFDSAMASHHLLVGILRQIEQGQERLDWQWDGGPVDDPPTRMTDNVARVRSFLERHGYHEISIATGNARDLAAQGRLGTLFALFDQADGRAHWTARVVFEANESPPDSLVE
jgi:ribosomal protein S14